MGEGRRTVVAVHAVNCCAQPGRRLLGYAERVKVLFQLTKAKEPPL